MGCTGERQEILVNRLRENGASLIGFGDVSVAESDLTDNFPVAVSLALSYDEKVVENLHLGEASFHDHLQRLNVRMEQLMSITEDLLSGWGYQYETIPLNVPVKSKEQLREVRTFAHKTAATCAGMGWVGKCALLVTPEYGPGIKLGTVLTDAGFETAEPMISDRCGECTLCVEACPYGAVHNVNWERGVGREELIAADVCNEKRLDFVPVMGRKHNCGLCLQACHVGKED